MTGHLKSSCNLAGKIVRQRDVYITLLAPMPLYEKAQKEVALQFKPVVEDHLHKLIRYLSNYLYLFSNTDFSPSWKGDWGREQPCPD